MLGEGSLWPQADPSPTRTWDPGRKSCSSLSNSRKAPYPAPWFLQCLISSKHHPLIHTHSAASNQTLSHRTFQLVPKCSGHLPRRCREPTCSTPSLLWCPTLIKQITGAHSAPHLHPKPSGQWNSWTPATRAGQTHETPSGPKARV